MKLMLEVANICGNLKGYQNVPGDSHHIFFDFDEFKTQAAGLDAKLHDWYQDLPHDWTCSTKPITLDGRPEWALALLKHAGAPKVMHEYSNNLVTLDLNMFRATRLHLNFTMLAFEYSSPTMTSLEKISLIVSRITEIIEDMCAGIPFALQITPSGKDDPPDPLHILGQRGQHRLFPLMMCGRCFQRAEVISQDVNGRRFWIYAVARFTCRELGYAIVPLSR
jgi:hypothetical protein